MTNDTHLNPTTGLPELPENFRWRVNKYSIHISEMNTDWKRAAQFRGSVDTRDKADEYKRVIESEGYEARVLPVTIPGYGFLLFKSSVVEQFKVVYLQDRLIFNDPNGDVVYDAHGHEAYGRNDHAEMISRTNIIKRAEKTYKAFTQTRETLDLMGLYPPNVLHGPEDD